MYYAKKAPLVAKRRHPAVDSKTYDMIHSAVGHSPETDGLLFNIGSLDSGKKPYQLINPLILDRTVPKAVLGNS